MGNIAETERTADLETWLVALVSENLGVPAGEIDVTVPLTHYGMDSLDVVELSITISEVLECEVPDSLLLDNPTIETLAQYLKAQRQQGCPGSARTETPHAPFAPMLEDAVLPADVDPSGALPPGETHAVLVTGATGFLGAYLVRTLLRETTAQIYCLVRPMGNTDGLTRIRQAQTSYGIWDPSFEPRLHLIPGNIGQPRLGLPVDQYAALCRRIDVVYHSAAKVSWVSPYAGLRDVNIGGTLELLRLACRYKQKPFHFVSSAAVCYATAGLPEVNEGDAMLPFLHGLHLGYAQSKCVAETLVRVAGERGLPVSIYRPSFISGDSRSGHTNSDDILSRLIKGCIQMECAPDLDWLLDCCPVDYVADAIVHLSRNGSDSLGVFHLANPSLRHWRECVLWMNLFGYRIRLMPYRSWLSRLEAESRIATHPLHPLRSFFLTRPVGAEGLTLPELYEEGKKSRLRCDRTRQALTAHATACPSLNARLLDRYFSSFIDRGFLPAVTRPGSLSGVAAVTALDRGFFATILRRFHHDDSIQVLDVIPRDVESEHSIISELTSWRYGRAAGLSRVSVVTASRAGAPTGSLELVVKVKPKDEEVMEVGERVAALCGDELGRAFARFKKRTGLAGCHLRELAIYRQEDDRFRRHAPTVYGTVQDDDRRSWILVLENLTDMFLMDTVEDVSGWRSEPIEAAVHGISEVQAIWYGRETELLAQPWLGPVLSAADVTEMEDLWLALAEHADRYFSAWMGPSLRSLQRDLIAGAGEWWRSFETMPRTLIHNDFNPRNLAFRKTGHRLRLCAYDWELATLGVPQHDLAELLCFVLTAVPSKEEVLHYLEVHRLALQQATGRMIDPTTWRLGFRLSLYDLILNRFPMYAMVHTFRRQAFLERVIWTWRNLYELFPYG